MPTVWIPPLLRGLTGDRETVSVAGETVGELINNLEATYPGIKERLVQDDRMRPGLSVAIDGEIGERHLRQRLQPESEVHFVPAISGGA